ncbi:MAG: A/G-specific adenine glycosylase [Bdellovibrionales bacterium]
MNEDRPFSLQNQTDLLSWYRQNQRPLPWRINRDPYRIWLSETMLQQTTVTAVIPYFERFLKRFPTLQHLAKATENEVREQWAGLGYYSRASNLWRAARAFQLQGGFPKTHLALGEFPGFGPYTSRAVSSLAFDENVGVLDGNVIRVLSRFHNWPAEWWRPNVRQKLQATADRWVDQTPSHEMNQAVMELGATICTPKNPTCLLCPLRASCQGLKKKKLAQLPLPKPRRAREIWLWEAELHLKKGKVALIANHGLPFLRGHLVPPGQARRLQKKPTRYAFAHSITHHDIFVRVLAGTAKSIQNPKWIPIQQLAKHSPAALVKKVLAQNEK